MVTAAPGSGFMVDPNNPNAVISSSPTPIPAAPMTADTLNSSEQPLNLPSVPSPYVPDIQSIVAEPLQAAAPTATEQKQSSYIDQLLTSIKSLGGRSQAQIDAEKASGVTDFTTQLNDVNSQVQSLQKEALAIPLQIQNDYAGKGTTSGGVEPIQTAQLRTNAIKALSLSAIAATLQGNISLAQQRADKAVEAQFAPIQANIDYLKTALEMNSQQLSREDAKKATQMKAELDDRQRLLDQQKEDKTNILSLVGSAAKNSANPAPSSVINQALNAKTPQEALALLSPYLTDPNSVAKSLAEIDQTRAQTAYYKAQTAELAQKTENTNGTKVTPEVSAQRSNAINLVNTLIEDPSLSTATGASGVLDPRNYIPGTAVQSTKNQIAQLKGILALDKRSLLKGSGAVSDFEGRTLDRAASAFDTNLSDKDAVKELKQVRGSLVTMAGGAAMITVKDPKDGSTAQTTANSDQIQKMVNDGLIIEYQ